MHVVDDQVDVLHRGVVHEVVFLVMILYLFVLDYLEVAVVAEHRPETFVLKLVQDVSRVLAVVCPIDRT
jgi:hypothetical protein